MKKVHFNDQLSMFDHLVELRNRLFVCTVVLLIYASAAFYFRDSIAAILSKPLGAPLYYSSVSGGLEFILQMCLLVGVILTFPVFTYNIAKFIEPAGRSFIIKRLGKYCFVSFLLALTGAFFAFIFVLPASVSFLTGFNDTSLEALVTADRYVSFVSVFIGGFALIFQLPLLISIVDRQKPIPPKSLYKNIRLVILASFILAALITPTPDFVNQMMLALPTLLLYHVGVMIVVWRDRKRKKIRVAREAWLSGFKHPDSIVPAIDNSSQQIQSHSTANTSTVLQNKQHSNPPSSLGRRINVRTERKYGRKQFSFVRNRYDISSQRFKAAAVDGIL